MFKKAKIMFIYTETSLHVGSGTSLGVIDLPIQREKYTDYPIIQASGIKGAVRDWFETMDKRNGEKDKDKVKLIFGPDAIGGTEEAFAGAATFTDGKLLLLPVRSLKGVFAYTTSCFALSRLKRDLQIAGVPISWDVPPEPQDNQVFGVDNNNLGDGDKVLLEEYVFELKEDSDIKVIAEWFSQSAFPKGDEYAFWRDKVKKDLIILSENAFRDFVKLSTEVQARIKIDNETKTVKAGALFYEEALPSDTLLYSITMANDPFCDSNKRPNKLKDAESVITFISKLDGQRAQFGGDTTIGKGIVSIRF